MTTRTWNQYKSPKDALQTYIYSLLTSTYTNHQLKNKNSVKPVIAHHIDYQTHSEISHFIFSQFTAFIYNKMLHYYTLLGY